MKFPLRIQLIFLLFFFACSTTENEQRKNGLSGYWRGVIQMQGQELPFNFELEEEQDSLRMRIFNAEESLTVNDLYWQGDTLHIPMHIFDTEIQAVVESGRLKGKWVKKYAEDYELPFSATRDDFRFPEPEEKPAFDISGKWATTFYKGDSLPDDYNAVGIFRQSGSELRGTFLTPTGDYRYLEGSVEGNQLQLSAFDGENAYLFQGTLEEEDQLKGTFMSGKSGKSSWIANRNEKAGLPDPDSLTYLKEGYSHLEFEFPNLEGKRVSLRDPKYQDKVVIIQLFGTWCPNCMDETRFLAEWYKKHQKEDVAIIGLAYEQKDDFEYARRRVMKMKDKLDVGYDLLIAGTSNKKAAAETLPMLNHILSFPTTIFLGKDGNVRKIHTGFSGPGTGEYYTRFVEEFNLFTDKLLAE